MKKIFTKTTLLFALLLTLYSISLRGQKLFNTVGNSSGGGLIKFNVADNSIIELGQFSSVNIASPKEQLVHVGNGVLFGLTNNSPSLYGAVYSTDTTTNVINLLYQFSNYNAPVTGFTLADDGKLYTIGATATGSYRAIYSFNTTTNAYTEVYALPGGTTTTGLMLKASNGLLYGVSQRGGINDLGYMFSYNTATSAFSLLYDFNTVNGTLPQAGLIQASNGLLYGLAAYGGANDKGVLYSYNTTNSTFTKLFDFVQSTGENPSTPMIQGSDGKLYGVTMTGGGSYTGALYSFDPTSNNYSVLHNFSASDGYNPRSFPTEATTGVLYGATSAGGANFKGTIYKYDLINSTFTKLVDGTNDYSFSAPFLNLDGLVADIKELNKSNVDFTLYPNPCSDRIHFSSNFPNVNYKFEICNSIGQTIKSGIIRNNTIETAELSKNVYTIRITGDQLNSKVYRFIKE
jgi:uncharacterized repeat protein (TIGR03803 family)